MSARDRYRKPARGETQSDPGARFLIVCEGKNTEPQYLRQFAAYHRSLVDFEKADVEVIGGQGVPMSVVLKAKELRDEAEEIARREEDVNAKYDHVWCVFDVDEHPNVKGAKKSAQDNKLKVAVSNPCFELWLVLHLTDAPGLIHRHAVQAMLGKLVPGYDKKVDFEIYRKGYEMAVKQAKRLDAVAEQINDPEINPRTTVYMLTESIAAKPQVSARARPSWGSTSERPTN
jgi:hypothetical protein